MQIVKVRTFKIGSKKPTFIFAKEKLFHNEIFILDVYNIIARCQVHRNINCNLSMVITSGPELDLCGFAHHDYRPQPPLFLFDRLDESAAGQWEGCSVPGVAAHRHSGASRDTDCEHHCLCRDVGQIQRQPLVQGVTQERMVSPFLKQLLSFVVWSFRWETSTLCPSPCRCRWPAARSISRCWAPIQTARRRR